MPTNRNVRSTYTPLALLVVLDVACVLAVARLPDRVELAQPALDVPAAAPTLAVATPTAALFVTTDVLGNTARSVVSRVPFDGHAPTVHPVGDGLVIADATPRWAWNGRTLLVAAGEGMQRVCVFTVAADGRVSRPVTLDGVRSSAGWARDHFEVTRVTAGDAPGGRVVRVLDVDDAGAVSHDRVAPEAVGSFAWPDGVRRAIDPPGRGSLVLPDGTQVTVPTWRDAHARAWFDLDLRGTARAHFTHFVVTRGSPLIGAFTARTDVGYENLVIESRVGAREPRPRFIVSRDGHRGAFESNAEARPRDVLAVVRDGRVHIVDPHGFHAVVRASDLSPAGPRTARVTWLIAAIGPLAFACVLLALSLAHVLALFVARASRPSTGPVVRRLAAFASSAALVCGIGALLAVLFASPP